MEEKQKVKGMTGLEEQETTGVSPWMLSLVDELGEQSQAPHWTYSHGDFTFEIVEGRQSLWVTSRFPAGGQVALRAAYCPDGELAIDEIRQLEIENAVEIHVTSTIGNFLVEVHFPREDRPVLHYRTTLDPVVPLLVPFWPRDVMPLGKDNDVTRSEGMVHAKQVGPRSGLVYFSLTRPRGGSVLYFQNLASLNEYCKQTETSLADTVGGEWPELGFALPAASGKALEAAKEIVISDVYAIFTPTPPGDDLAMAQRFLESLAQIYLALPRNETEYVDWPTIAKKSLRDLSTSEKCWSEVDGRPYLNAYVGDHDNPPESMVQLTVLLPLLEYAGWSGKEIPFTEELLAGLPGFYDKKAGVVGRWLPLVASRLDGSEPQKKPEVMDSWYLFHTLLNLSRLALHGDDTIRRLFLDSMDYAIRIANKFEYHFPVFYDLYTLETIKPETADGQGGEHDVAGLYAHVMLQAWELTKEDRYLEEAKRAGRVLKGLGFNLFYQANETLFGAGALLRIWKETGEEEFLQLSYLSLANAFNNMWLWECDYGYAEQYKTFFALFPLKEAPYTAVYEELEGFAALHDYITRFPGDAPEWLNVLIPEFLRNMLYKASYYYPPNLPLEAMAEKPKTGELDPKLWIPLEDIYDGWEKAGQVGQEVYGAGLPFGLIPRHYWPVPSGKFMIYVDYPIKSFSTVHEGQAMFRVLGDSRLSCRMRIIPTGRKGLPEIKVTTERDSATETLQGARTEEGHLEFTLPGDRNVVVHWEAEARKPRAEKKITSSNGRKGKKK